jgi:hypothetical protein
MPLSRARTLPIVIFTVALIFRSLTAAFLLHDYGSALFYHDSELSYIAAHLAAGEGYSAPYEHVPILPTAQQPPLYPFLLAGIFRIFGSFTSQSLCVLLAIQSLAGATTALMICVAGSRYFTRSIGLFAACFWAFWPFESLFDLPIGIYGLSALAVSLWFVNAPHVLAISNRSRDWILLGIAGGIILLLNPTLAVVLLASVAWVRRREHIGLNLFFASTALLLVLAPWTVRNYIAFHRFVPMRDNLGSQLFVGNHPGMTGEDDFDGFPSHDPREYSQLGEMKYMDLKQSEALEFIRHDPTSFVRRAAKRFVDFWVSPGFIPMGIVSILAWVCIGIALLNRVGRQMGIFLAVSLFFFPTIYYVSRFWTVYRHPIEPVMLLAAFSTIQTVSGVLSKRPNSSDSIPHINRAFRPVLIDQAKSFL